MCLLQLPCTVEYLYRYLHMFLYQYRTQKTRYRGKAKSSAAATREKTFSSTNNSCNGNDVYICISTMERLFPTNEICRNISFLRAKRSCSLFTDYYTSWGSADRIYVCWSIYMMTDVGWWCWRPYLYNYRVNIDILYIKMNVYSSAIDVSTLCAPLEAFNASADRIKLIQTCCTDNSTRCTQIYYSNFRHQLYNAGMSNFNFKGMIWPLRK